MRAKSSVTFVLVALLPPEPGTMDADADVEALVRMHHLFAASDDEQPGVGNVLTAGDRGCCRPLCSRA